VIRFELSMAKEWAGAYEIARAISEADPVHHLACSTWQLRSMK